MRTWRGWGKRLRAWIADETRDRQLGDELESIVDMHIDEYLRSGMTRDEARRRALIEVGGLEQVRQAVGRGVPVAGMHDLGNHELVARGHVGLVVDFRDFKRAGVFVVGQDVGEHVGAEF